MINDPNILRSPGRNEIEDEVRPGLELEIAENVLESMIAAKEAMGFGNNEE